MLRREMIRCRMMIQKIHPRSEPPRKSLPPLSLGMTATQEEAYVGATLKAGGFKAAMKTLICTAGMGGLYYTRYIVSDGSEEQFLARDWFRGTVVENNSPVDAILTRPR